MHHATHTDPRSPETIDRAILRHGFAVVAVGYGDCGVPGCCSPPEAIPWSYTVGLSQVGEPELVLLGLDPISAHLAISWVATQALAGRPVPLDQPFDLRHVATKVVDVPDEWLLTDPERMAVWFADREHHERPSGLPRVRQVVWADDQGRFPDDASYRPPVALVQPMLRDDPFSIPHRAARAGRPATRSARARRRIA